MAETVDLRSDTVTRPTAEMRRAMAEAEVGDDVYGEDPTVRRLQERAAELFGREAALYCPSGVMCNQLWLRVLARPGTEVVVEADSHVVNYEGAAGALLGGVQFRTVPSRYGQLEVDDLREAVRADHFPLTPASLVWLEQTHNRRGGTYYSVGQLEAVRALCDERGVGLYIDGARILNAAVASSTDPDVYGRIADGLMFSLSKGLGAPVGSLMVGDADAIAAATEWRRRYGGAMRQSGVIAAAGLVALDRIERLADDHAHARLIAEAVADVRPDTVDLPQVQTNIVYVNGVDAADVCARLREHGVLAGAMDAATVRMVTHPDVSAQGAKTAAEALRRVLG
ncbi:MAG TPA: GntG family PLP-dependent aldolase [Egibacteraceae bacterium]|nr:GntG family PLP-dependent aldolase [Egibacteraceae bacterium]